MSYIRRTLTRLVTDDEWARVLKGDPCLELFPDKEGYVVVFDGKNITDKGIVVAAHYEPLDAGKDEA